MQLFSLATWWLGDALLVCLLWRSWTQRQIARYPYFYAYIWTVLLSDGICHVLYAAGPSTYQANWWIFEFITAIVGFGITWEIFEQMLLPYRGVQRLARGVLLTLFALVFIRTAAAWKGTPLRSLMPTTVELEQNLRVLQALLLLVIVGLIAYYALPMGRNVKLMLWGYGTYLGVYVVLLTVRSEWGSSFDAFESVLPPLAYCVTLVVWCVGMWSFEPNPKPDLTLEQDYDRLSRQTGRALVRLRDHLMESWRA